MQWKGRWEIKQMKARPSPHPVAWAVSVAETMSQRWLRTSCLCGGQGSAGVLKGTPEEEEEGGKWGFSNSRFSSFSEGRIKTRPWIELKWHLHSQVSHFADSCLCSVSRPPCHHCKVRDGLREGWLSTLSCVGVPPHSLLRTSWQSVCWGGGLGVQKKLGCLWNASFKPLLQATRWEIPHS